MVTITTSHTTKRTTPSRPRLIGGKREVPVLNGWRVRSVNLDSAASTPPLVQVQRIVEDFLPWYASVHRGTGYKSRLSTHLYDHARDVVMRFVGADPSTHTVVFVVNVIIQWRSFLTNNNDAKEAFRFTHTIAPASRSLMGGAKREKGKKHEYPFSCVWNRGDWPTRWSQEQL